VNFSVGISLIAPLHFEFGVEAIELVAIDVLHSLRSSVHRDWFREKAWIDANPGAAATWYAFLFMVLWRQKVIHKW